MSCKKCEDIADIEDLSFPYVIRQCSNCNRDIKIREPGEGGKGIKVEKGDRFQIPAGFIQFSANPLASNTKLTRSGLQYYAKLVFIGDVSKNEEKLDEIIEANEKYCIDIFSRSEHLREIDFTKDFEINDIFEKLENQKSTAEWWAILFTMFNYIAREAIEENDARKAAWAMGSAERCRSMCVYKEHFDDVVFMGNSARRIIDVISTWHANKTNNIEKFWQDLFNENPYVLSQVFSVPVLFIQDNAYVGGMKTDRKNAKFVDFLFKGESSNDAILIEIKTPEAQILSKNPYRKSVYVPSRDMTGAAQQVLNYRRTLIKDVQSVVSKDGHKLETFDPKCIVIMGNAEKELNCPEKRNSFELFRANSKDVEIVTFDELFRKAETLASLFNLVWKEKET
ncbi:MAG: hypothetical protein COB93_07695 [Sneathiella sp.]|nr:MAG: hypothetical protein COB93_07695 [Sneathiella sp.]